MLGDLIKSARKEKGLTQQELANRIGINIRNVQKYEANEVKPRKKTLDKISSVLDINLDQVVSIDDIPSINEKGILYITHQFKYYKEMEVLLRQFQEILIKIDSADKNVRDELIEETTKFLNDFEKYLDVFTETKALINISYSDYFVGSQYKIPNYKPLNQDIDTLILEIKELQSFFKSFRKLNQKLLSSLQQAFIAQEIIDGKIDEDNFPYTVYDFPDLDED